MCSAITDQPALCTQRKIWVYLIVIYLTMLSVTLDRVCGLVVRVPGYITEMYCASCEVKVK
jgi:hypothetical protein